MKGYNTFLEKLEQKLYISGFEIKSKISLSPYQLDLLAVKSSWEVSKFGKMARFILVTSMEDVDTETLKDFSSISTKYAIKNRGSLLPRSLGGSLLSVPVIISEDFKVELKRWVENTLAKKHWAAFEFPVIISLKEKKIYYCKKNPIWGLAYYKGFRKFVEKQLSF